jgi:hypothetical protein
MSLEEVRLAAIQRAYDLGHADVALMILSGKANVRRRTTKEPHGWQLNIVKPAPKAAQIVILADCYATGKPEAFYVVPVADLKVILRRRFDHYFPNGRPRTPDSEHSALEPEVVADYRDAWGGAEEQWLADCTGYVVP